MSKNNVVSDSMTSSLASFAEQWCLMLSCVICEGQRNKMATSVDVSGPVDVMDELWVLSNLNGQVKCSTNRGDQTTQGNERTYCSH